MRYCITMEQTRRIAVYFDADSDDSAEEKAAQIYDDSDDLDFASGDISHDYALCNTDTGRTILDWD